MSYEHRRRKETQKYLRKNYYHHIKCTVTTFLTAFMWRKHLNNEVLATTTHKKSWEVSDGTDTQVIFQTVDKCRIKMIQKELYNVKLLRLGTYSYLCLKFNLNRLWTHDNCCPNSLRPSFLTHSLQIYWLGLIGPTYPILRFGPQIETLPLLLLLLLYSLTFFFRRKTMHFN